MKKLAFGMLAASALMVTGCASDEPANGVASDGRVTFELTAPDMAPTRAIGQNEAVNDLRVVIFDKDGNYLHTDKFDNKFAGVTTATVDLNLVKGEKYTLAFWVDNNYGYAIKDGVISMGYVDENGSANANLLANDDTRDAYYATAEVTVGQDYTKTVTLRRPFAQVNFGAADYAYAATLNKDFSKSNFTVKKVYDKMNLCSGVLSDEQASVTFKVAGHPAAATTPEALRVNSKDYGWIGMNYILVGAEGGTLDEVSLELCDANGVPAYNGDISYTSVPVKRNFRTNILGDLFTAETEWDLEIDQNFNKPDLLGPWDGTSTKEVTPETTTIEVNGDNKVVQLYSVASPAELAWVAENVKGTDAYIRLTDNVDLNDQPFPGFGTDNRKGADADMFQGVFDGNNKIIKNLKVNCTTDDHGSGLIRTAYNATVKNVTIEGVTMTSDDFMGGVVGYCKGNTTISNCHVKNCNLSSGDTAGGIVGKASYTAGSSTTITGCTASGTISGQKAGGIVGHTPYINAVINISGCKNYATINTTYIGGGICAMVGTGVQISDCLNEGNVGTSTATYCASMIGYYSAYKMTTGYVSSISECTNSGQIIAAAGSQWLRTIVSVVSQSDGCSIDLTNNRNEGAHNAITVDSKGKPYTNGETSEFFNNSSKPVNSTGYTDTTL